MSGPNGAQPAGPVPQGHSHFETDDRIAARFRPWTNGRDGARWLAGMISLTVAGISVAIGVEDMEFKAVGAFFAVLGLVGSAFILFRWDSQ
jgi:hypothetical protein